MRTCALPQAPYVGHHKACRTYQNSRGSGGLIDVRKKNCWLWQPSPHASAVGAAGLGFLVVCAGGVPCQADKHRAVRTVVVVFVPSTSAIAFRTAP